MGRAYNAECMACEEGLTVDEFCESHKEHNFPGCGIVDDDNTTTCCDDLEANCVSCHIGYSYDMFCEEFSFVPGCPNAKPIEFPPKCVLNCLAPATGSEHTFDAHFIPTNAREACEWLEPGDSKKDECLEKCPEEIKSLRKPVLRLCDISFGDHS